MSKPTGTHEFHNIALHWREWFRNRQYDIAYQDEILRLFTEQVQRLKGDEFKRMSDVFAEMEEERWENFRKALAIQESELPLAFFKPSWEQAQVLNAWHPEFDPIDAPNGYRSVCLFCGNQIGKTCVSVVTNLLWMTPNDPDWDIFQEYEDESAKKRGKYRVRLRPDWEYWRRTGKMMYDKSKPPMDACECWHGVENDKAWSDKVLLEYQKWYAKDWVGRRSDGGSAIFVQDRRIESKYGHRITGKTFNADIQDWAGKAGIRFLTIDEGIPPHLLREGLIRVGGGGYFMWPYTPVEARNIGDRAKTAWKVYKGELKLVGSVKFFLDFNMLDAPEQVCSDEKKNDNLSRWTGTEGEDKIRREGGFFNSSPNVFNMFDRARNILPIDGAEVLAAIRGEVVTRWVEAFGATRAAHLQWAFNQANIIRGMDEGLANPTACDWTAVLKTGEHVSFKEWQESGLSVSERCREIVERSGNTVECLNPLAVEERRVYREKVEPNGMKVRRTFGDSKMFVRNPESPKDDRTEVYFKAGLKFERATNVGPAARCDYVNDMLRGEANRKHLLHPDMPGPRGYVTRDCLLIIERFENYLWQQIAQGQRAGEFTDQPEKKDDHRVDSLCYSWGAKLKWRDPAPSAAPGVRYDRLTGAVLR